MLFKMEKNIYLFINNDNLLKMTVDTVFMDIM